MAVYKISAVARNGSVLTPGAASTAGEALAKLRAARQEHSRVWVNDEDGNDVSENELERRVGYENKHA